MLKQRRSSKFKTDVVLELLRGETLESLSRKYGVTMGEIDSWRKLKMVAKDSRKTPIIPNWLKLNAKSVNWRWKLS